MSNYQEAGIPADLKRRIAQLGINMLFKMVSWRPRMLRFSTWTDCVRESAEGSARHQLDGPAK